eukprot:1978105-Lingulodinium_polyedra.AAC.1
MGVGGKAQGLAEVTVPAGKAGISGVIEWTVVEDDNCPPLTPVNLLHSMGAVVNLPDLKMEFRKIGKETKLEKMPTGRVAHSLL